MTSLAAELTNRVIPFVPVRQFVLSVPHRLRYLLACDHARCTAVLRIFYAERWIGSIRRECLAKVIPLSERHLRKLVSEFVVHYHAERNHQSLGNNLIVPINENAAHSGRVMRR